MTTRAFDLACLLPPSAAAPTDMIVCQATSPQLQTEWAPSVSGGAFVPPANAVNQIVVSGPVGVAYSNSQVPTDGQVYGRGNNVWTACLPLTGGAISGALSVSGQLTVPAIPVSTNNATSKSYVDAQVAASIVTMTQYTDNAVGALDCGTY